MIELRNIKKSFNDNTVLDGVDFSVQSSGIYTVTGISGSGKSTLLNIITLLEKPDSGEIYYQNNLLTDLLENQCDSFRSNVFGFIFQDYSLIESLTLYDNLMVSLEGKDDTAITEILANFSLNGKENQIVSTLSGGEKQRAAIARALLSGAKVLIADEPTGSLDEDNAKNVMDTLKTLSKEMPVILVTHDRLIAETYSDKLYEIKNGKLIESDLTSKTIIPIAPNSNHDLPITPRKTEIKVAKKILKASKKVTKKTVLQTVLAACMMLLSAILSMFFGINSDKSYDAALYASDYKQIPIIMDADTFYLPPAEYDNLSDNLKQSSYKYIHTFISLGRDNDESIYANSVRNAIIDSKVPCGETWITDYVADCMLNYRTFPGNDTYNSLIGKIIKGKTITKIIHTDYKDRVVTQNDYDVDNYYSAMYISETDYNNSLRGDQTLNNIVIYFSDGTCIDTYPHIYPDSTLSYNEVILPGELSSGNPNNIYPEGDLAGMKLSFSLSLAYPNKNPEFNDMVCIRISDSKNMYVNEKVFNYLANSIMADGIMLKNDDNFKSNYVELKALGYRLNIKHAEDYTMLQDFVKSYGKYFLISAIFLAIISIMLFYDLEKHFVIKHQRDSFILKAIGYPKKYRNYLIAYEGLFFAVFLAIFAVIALIISPIILSAIIYLILNIHLKYNLLSAVLILLSTLIGYLLSILFTVIFSDKRRKI